ncbi:portal protein [Ralstonia syzygii]|uniref:Phage head-tail adapter protein n=2 Tax=Ralstonia syzygii subsp. celebesensis TaxID=1310168 RepID=A0A1U9VEL3_9RALS|nr:portal protein [Ralstonia syzygii]AQW29119.1 phage head-tail adapter protein [blood disease bacterium A2-HR MARDI]CCA79411.1 putative phage head-tail connector protein (p21) [blood disease bacterium R229]
MADVQPNLPTPARPKLVTRWGQLKSERASWWAHWKEISDHLLPRSGRFFVQDRDRGYRRHNNIYDSTGTRALRVLAAGMMAGMTSPARPWFRLAVPDPDLTKYGPVKVWLNEVTQMMQTVFERSNTYRTLHSMYEELGAFGTAASFVMDDFSDVIRHYPLTTGEYCIATDYRGQVSTLYREFQKTVAELVGEFGRDKCSTTVQNLYDRGSLDQWVTIIHAVEPRTDRDPRMRDALNMAWKSVYFEVGAQENKYLRESGFKDFRAVVPRWATAGGDIYGNSPGMEALGDIKQLQHEQLAKAKGINYKVNPPLQVPTSMKNRDVETLPGGISFVDAANPHGGIRSAFEVNLDLSHLLNDIQDVRQRINSTFYTDMFLMLANGVDQRMTATEVAERHEEKMLMLGPVLERLHNELLDPLVEMTFARMIGAGIVPPPPQELQGQDLNVEFVSMLAQAQRAVGTNSVDRFVGNLGQVAQFKPDVLDKFDSDKWADVYADMLGVDPELIVADDKVALVRQQRAQQQQAAQQAAMVNQAADTAQKLGSTPTNGGNAASDIMQMFTGYTTGA